MRDQLGSSQIISLSDQSEFVPLYNLPASETNRWKFQRDHAIFSDTFVDN